MENPRPEKVAVVDEVRERLSSSSAALLTEYRGLDVRAIGELRRALREAGGDYKIYKNTLVRFAARELGLEIDELLTGPTAIAFITTRPDGSPGDAALVAKALRDFGRTNTALVMKGGVLGDSALTAEQARALADIESREVLLARLAGALAAPMQQFAGLLQALPQGLAYGLKALIDQGGAPGAPAGDPAIGAPDAPPTPPTTDTAEQPDVADAAPTPPTTDTAEQPDVADAVPTTEEG